MMSHAISSLVTSLRSFNLGARAKRFCSNIAMDDFSILFRRILPVSFQFAGFLGVAFGDAEDVYPDGYADDTGEQ